MSEEIILEARDIWHSYEENDRFSLQGLDLKVKKGSKVAFMGANGSGKSTFFLCCNGILRPQKGDILFHGKPVSYKRKELLALRAKVGIVFQDPDKQLFSASVEQEISFGILNLGVAKEQARTEVEQVMEELEIVPFRKRPVHALSGGQKKQVSIADILVMRPEIIILDEPAAALDPKHTRMVNEMVDKLTEQGITVLMATHDMDYAYAWADEIVLMKDGKVLCQGAPEAVCRETEKLKETNLEEPALLRLFDRLKARKIIEATGKAPRTWKELEPTHIINGIENEKMLEEIQKHASSFEKVLVGKPLLSEPDDYKKTVHAVMEDVDLEEGECLILMGHGTDHHANSAYPALEYTLQALGYDRIHVATVEGFPELKDVMHRIEQKQYRKVALLPFMFVAGDHAKNDMAGDEDSWKCELEEAGYEVRPILRGLGELPGIRQIFMEHLEEAQ